MKHCPHGFLVPPDLEKLPTQDVVRVGSLVSPFCLTCWADPNIAELLAARFYEKPAWDDPCVYGYCDLISQVAHRRGFARDSFAREGKELDLRVRLIEKKATIEAAIAGKSPEFASNYVRKVLKNRLTNEQTRGEGRIISGSTTSLSDEGFRTDRKALSRRDAGNELLDLTGGDSATQDDDFSLDAKDTLVVSEPEAPEFGKAKRKQSEARNLFDKMQAEALATISTLTGGRRDGHDTYMDLERALLKLPEPEQAVFSALFLENGELLNRPRTYPEAESLTGISIQTIRTLEKRATQALRPALGPAFFKRRQAN